MSEDGIRDDRPPFDEMDRDDLEEYAGRLEAKVKRLQESCEKLGRKARQHARETGEWHRR